MNGHRNPSGLHNLVKELIKCCDVYRMEIDEKVHEKLYNELCQALDYFCELKFIPKTLFKHTIGLEFIKLYKHRSYREVKHILMKELNHEKRYYIACKIAKFMLNDWKITDSDFNREITEKNWIKKYNETVN